MQVMPKIFGVGFKMGGVLAYDCSFWHMPACVSWLADDLLNGVIGIEF